MHASVQTVLNALCRPRAQLRILVISEIITNRVASCSTLSLPPGKFLLHAARTLPTLCLQSTRM